MKVKVSLRKQINAQDLWFAILTCKIETGTPYLLYKGLVIKNLIKITRNN